MLLASSSWLDRPEELDLDFGMFFVPLNPSMGAWLFILLAKAFFTFLNIPPDSKIDQIDKCRICMSYASYDIKCHIMTYDAYDIEI